MLRTALTVGLLTLSSSPEPHPLPPDVNAARVLSGTALLVTKDAPEGRLTLLPEGVYFNADGYQRLSIATQSLQASLRAMEARVKEYEAQALTPCPLVEPPTLKGWSARDVLLAGAVGVVVGVAGAVVLHGLVQARTP